MRRRRSKRYIVFFNAEIISGSMSYTGVICNISKNGMCIRVKSMDAKINIKPGTILNVKFKLPSEEMLNLRCMLVWSYEIPPVTSHIKFTYKLGMEVIDPLPEYKELYINVAMKNLNDQIKSISG